MLCLGGFACWYRCFFACVCVCVLCVFALFRLLALLLFVCLISWLMYVFILLFVSVSERVSLRFPTAVVLARRQRSSEGLCIWLVHQLGVLHVSLCSWCPGKGYPVYDIQAVTRTSAPKDVRKQQHELPCSAACKVPINMAIACCGAFIWQLNSFCFMVHRSDMSMRDSRHVQRQAPFNRAPEQHAVIVDNLVYVSGRGAGCGGPRFLMNSSM